MILAAIILWFLIGLAYVLHGIDSGPGLSIDGNPWLAIIYSIVIAVIALCWPVSLAIRWYYSRACLREAQVNAVLNKLRS